MVLLSCSGQKSYFCSIFYGFSLPALVLFSLSVIFGFSGPKPDETGSTNPDDKELRKTEWQDMRPHTMEGSYYNEFWNYHFFLQDDLHLHVTFSLANFGTFKSAVSGGKLFVSNFKGNNYNVAREFTQERFVIDDEAGKLRLHSGREIYLQGMLPEKHHIKFEASKDGVAYMVDLHLYDIHDGYTWGDGVYQIDGNAIGIFVHIPKASVRGTVAINEDTVEVRGTAYMDHTYQTDLASKIVDKGFRYISHTDDGYYTGYFLIPKDQSRVRIAGIGLNSMGDNVSLNKPDDINILSSDRIDGKTVPRSMEIKYTSGEKRTFNRKVNFQGVSFLEEIGGLRRRLVRSFLGGEVIDYVGTGDLDGRIPVNYSLIIVH